MDKLYSVDVWGIPLGEQLHAAFKKSSCEAFKKIVVTASQLCNKSADVDILRKTINIVKNLNEVMEKGSGPLVVSKENLDLLKDNMKNAKGWLIDEDLGFLILEVEERILNAVEFTDIGGAGADTGADKTV